ncbi:MAG: hypothetical protein HY681_12330 [Chloroflexi bacterium]|nr:hypothetical protein [Chloroflexota bacterium]
MYDVHCHILPDLDDGPKTLEAALEMARIAAADGTKAIVATPHAEQVAARGGCPFLEERVQAFRHELQANGIGLDLVTGVEHVLTVELLKEAKEGRAVTLNGSHYILVELDFFQWPPFAEDAFFQLQIAGYTPVLAHPERQATIQKEPERLARLVEAGVLAQVTAGSLLGEFGGTALESAEELVRRGLVHCIASDGHSPEARRRPPLMSEARQALAELAGAETAQLLGIANPQAILGGKQVVLPDPPRRSRGKRFLWFGRG